MLQIIANSHRVQLLINVCKKAADNHLISFNPCKGVTLKKKSDFKPVKKSKEETKRLTEEEINLFLFCCSKCPIR